jgi:hypothetical protein
MHGRRESALEILEHRVEEGKWVGECEALSRTRTAKWRTEEWIATKWWEWWCTKGTIVKGMEG